MQPVSYNIFFLYFAIILYHSSRARGARCYPTRFASPLAYFFSPENFPVPPFLSAFRTLYHVPFDTSSVAIRLDRTRLRRENESLGIARVVWLVSVQGVREV